MRTKKSTLLILIFLTLSACGPRAAQDVSYPGGDQAWIDAPLPGSHLPLLPVEIMAHASSLDGIDTFQISLNGQQLAESIPDANSLDQSLKFTRYIWNPAAPGTYLIEVTAIKGDDQPGPAAQVTVVIEEVTATPDITEIATITNVLMFTPGFNALCREGPNEVFRAMEEPAMKGNSYLMDGRNLEGSWYRIMLTPSSGCWVPAGSGVPSDDPMRLRVLLEIPTPTLPPNPSIDCSSITDQGTCQAQSACRWIYSAMGAGVCAPK